MVFQVPRITDLGKRLLDRVTGKPGVSKEGRIAETSAVETRARQIGDLEPSTGIT